MPRMITRWPGAGVARQVADCALASLRCHEGGGLLAVGCADGTTAVLQLSDSLVKLQPSEKAATLAVRAPTARQHSLLLVLSSCPPCR